MRENAGIPRERPVNDSNWRGTVQHMPTRSLSGSAGMSEPRTEAGKAAQHMVPHFDWCAGMKGPNPCDCGVVEHILAIEEQAAAEARRELLAKVEGPTRAAFRAARRYQKGEVTMPADRFDDLLEVCLRLLDPSR